MVDKSLKPDFPLPLVQAPADYWERFEDLFSSQEDLLLFGPGEWLAIVPVDKPDGLVNDDLG